MFLCLHQTSNQPVNNNYPTKYSNEPSSKKRISNLDPILRSARHDDGNNSRTQRTTIITNAVNTTTTTTATTLK